MLRLSTRMLARPKFRPLNFRAKTTAAESLGNRMARGIVQARRGASFAFYSSLVLGGVAVIVVTGYYVGNELLLPNSEVQIMHRALHLVEHDDWCLETLGSKLKAHGEDVGGRSVLGRPLATRRWADRTGREHVSMHFHVDGERARGIVRLELIENREKVQYEYRYVVVDVPGHGQHYLVNNEPPKRSASLFGIHWGPKRE